MSQSTDETRRRRNLDQGVIDGDSGEPAETQYAGYIPRVPRPTTGVRPAAPPAWPPPAAPEEPLPWEDRPTVAMSSQSAAAPRPAATTAAPPRQSAAPASPPRQAAAPAASRPAPAAPAPPPWTPPVEEAPEHAPRRPAVYDPSRVSAAAPPARRRRRWVGPVFGVLAGLIVVALIGLFAYAGWYDQQYAGRIFPGVQVLGVDVGGKTPDEARVLLQNRVADFAGQPVVLTWHGQQWHPQPNELGMQVNLDGTVDKAYAVGRTGNLLATWDARIGAAQHGDVVPLSVSLDENNLLTYLQKQVAPQIDQPLQEGDVWLQGEQVKTTPAQEGRKLDVYAAVQTIRTSLSRLATSEVTLPVTVTTPQVTQAEVDQTSGALKTLLSAPLVAHHADKQFTVAPRDISQKLLKLQRQGPGAPHPFVIAFQDDNLQALVSNWADQIDMAPQNARFAWNNGQLAVLKESQDGVKVDQTAAIAAIKTGLATTDKRNVDLPIITSAPKVSSKDINALGIKGLIGQGTTSYKGSTQARYTNVKVSADYLNGVVVPPGDTFSFLDAVAPITLDRGYVEGYVIAAERTQQGVGGGVCQVSTTTFRAAFWSGLPITERHQHAYRVGWYESMGEPVGFDAAVFDPGVDLKFVNSTPGYLLIQTDMSNDELHVNFYGTKIADDVKLIGPQVENVKDAPPNIYQVDPTLPPGTTKQVETAHKGLDTTITRQIIKGGKVISQDDFFSRFEPWPNWYMVAPDVHTPNPPLAAATPTPNP